MSRERFDKAASQWDAKPRRVELAEKISAAISSHIPLSRAMNAMEFGCGTGLVGLALAPSLGHLTAIDSSRGMLDVLQEKIASQGLQNVRPLCYDLLHDNYRETHDLIFCAMTLHHIKDAEGLLARFAELLNPGGYLAVADLVTEDGSFHDPAAKGIHHHGFNPKRLSSFLSTLGMEDIGVETIHSIVKEEWENQQFPVFLLTARRPRTSTGA